MKHPANSRVITLSDEQARKITNGNRYWWNGKSASEVFPWLIIHKTEATGSDSPETFQVRALVENKAGLKYEYDSWPHFRLTI